MRRQRFVLEELSPTDLVPNPHNFRRHPAAQKNALQASIEEHGWVDAPLWNKKTGHLIDGHARVEQALADGESSIPVKVVEMPLSQERRLLRSFDAITGMALTDDRALEALIEAIDDAALEQLLGEVAEPVSGLLPEAGPDAIPERVETRVKAGDLWRLGEHRLLCGDATKAEDVARLMEGSRAEVCITSPPYNLGSDHHTDRKRTQSYPDDQPESVYQEQQRASLKAIAEVTTGDCFYQHKNRIKNGLWISPIAWVEVSPWRMAQEVVWINGGPNMDPRRFYPQTERIYWLTRPDTTTRLENREHLTDWWQIEPVGSDGEHKQCFPVELPRRLLVASGAGSVYDPFAGSGTTLIAAESLGRTGYALEISPEFCDVILQRWSDATGKEPERL